MIFWKVLRWIGSIAVIALSIAAWMASTPGGDGTGPSLAPAPTIVR